jgi:hypothetical protein
MPDEYKSVMVVSVPGTTQFLTVDNVREEFERYGDVTHIEMFHYNKNNQRNWGKVTFKTTKQAENAVAESQEEDIIARPTGNARLQNPCFVELRYCSLFSSLYFACMGTNT